MEAVKMETGKVKDQTKDRLGLALLGIIHLVCCGLLLIFLAGGISIGVVTSYLEESLVPLMIVLVVIVTGWAAYNLWTKHRLNQDLRSSR
jgi:hypothetical protein